MDRFSLTDAQWEKMQPFCLGKPADPGRTGGDTRLFTEAVLWIARTGSLWWAPSTCWAEVAIARDKDGLPVVRPRRRRR